MDRTHAEKNQLSAAAIFMLVLKPSVHGAVVDYMDEKEKVLYDCH